MKLNENRQKIIEIREMNYMKNKKMHTPDIKLKYSGIYRFSKAVQLFFLEIRALAVFRLFFLITIQG